MWRAAWLSKREQQVIADNGEMGAEQSSVQPLERAPETQLFRVGLRQRLSLQEQAVDSLISPMPSYCRLAQAKNSRDIHMPIPLSFQLLNLFSCIR